MRSPDETKVNVMATDIGNVSMSVFGGPIYHLTPKQAARLAEDLLTAAKEMEGKETCRHCRTIQERRSDRGLCDACQNDGSIRMLYRRI